MNTVSPDKISMSTIPSTIFQTSTYKQPQYVVDLITSKCVDWKYEHFNEKEKIKYKKIPRLPSQHLSLARYRPLR